LVLVLALVACDPGLRVNSIRSDTAPTTSGEVPFTVAIDGGAQGYGGKLGLTVTWIGKLDSKPITLVPEPAKCDAGSPDPEHNYVRLFHCTIHFAAAGPMRIASDWVRSDGAHEGQRTTIDVDVVEA
jgi:hypothetical protein